MSASSGDALQGSGDAAPPATDGEIGPRGHQYAVRVRVNGEEVTLKAFLHDLIGGAVTGLLTGLRDVPEEPADVAHVELEVRRP